MELVLKDVLQDPNIASVTALVVGDGTEGAMDSLYGWENVETEHSRALRLCSGWDGVREDFTYSFVDKVSCYLMRYPISIMLRR